MSGKKGKVTEFTMDDLLEILAFDDQGNPVVVHVVVDEVRIDTAGRQRPRVRLRTVAPRSVPLMFKEGGNVYRD